MPEQRNNNIVFIVALIAGFLGAIYALIIMPSGDKAASRVRFEPIIPQPPENARVIEGSYLCSEGYDNHVAVSGGSGTIYVNCEAGWQVYNSPYGDPPPLEPCDFSDPKKYSPNFDKLYHPMQDCAMYYKSGLTVEETVYVVQEDHTLWRWDFKYGLSTFILYIGIGIVVGLLIGWVIGILVKGIMEGK